MPADPVSIRLVPEQFGAAERQIARSGALVATAFRYPSGVAGLHLDNGAGRVTMLPFQGQQIWDVRFLGRRLTMRSMIEVPVPGRDYLANYGGFLLHCGAAAMGNPGPEDDHPLHGELPNAPYDEATLVFGEDERGAYLELMGKTRHAVAFGPCYDARPSVRIRPGATVIEIAIEIENRRAVPMELMYLAHLNFRPVEGGRLVDTVIDDDRDIAIRTALPPGLAADPGFLAWRDRVAERPALHRTIEAGQVVDPELVMTLRCAADAAGWAEALQLHPDGTADLVRHRPAELDHAVRWMVRAPDMEALGLVLPATAAPDGRAAARAAGTVRHLPPGGTFRCAYEAGALDAAATAAALRRIAAVRDAALRDAAAQDGGTLR